MALANVPGVTGLDDLDRLRVAARPVVFAVDNDEAPFSVKGTAFLVWFYRRIFVITARHVVQGNSPQRLLIYPTPTSPRPLRIVHSWSVEEGGEQTDGSDIHISLADADHLPKSVRREMFMIDLTPSVRVVWKENRFNSSFFLFGYPAHTTYADYDAGKVMMGQTFFEGRYERVSSHDDSCHEISLKNPHKIPSFDGLSGSPVFSLPASIACSHHPAFCGIAIRGGVEAKSLHFVDSFSLRLALIDAVKALSQESIEPYKRRSLLGFD